MKSLIYYLLLLVFIAVLSGFLISNNNGGMSTPQMLGFSAALILYTIGISLVGEGASQDEKEVLHKNFSNRAGLIAGQVILSVAILYQLFVTHNIDYWLFTALIVINLTKIVSLVYLNYKK